MAAGKYFCRMDADDIMFPDRLRKQFEYLESHPAVDLLGSQAVVIDENNKILGIRRSVVPEHLETFLHQNPIIHPTVCGKTGWFRENRYNEDFNGAEDYELWIRTFPSSNFQIMPEPLLFYRDPLHLNIKSFHSRILKQIKIFEFHKNVSGFKEAEIRTFQGKALLKTLAYRIIKLGGQESFIIKRRNQPLSANEVEKFEKLLHSVIREN